MANIGKIEEASRQGMVYALRIVKEKGIEGLEEEIKMRNITRAPIAVPRKALDEVVDKIAAQTMDTFLVLTIHTLNDEFGFGQKRCQRFTDRFMSKTECLEEGYVVWNDITEVLKRELNLDLDIRFNDTDVRI